jgi:hypothetical protein
MACAGKRCPLGQACALDGPHLGKCVSATIVNYVAGPPLAALPACMRAAVQRSMKGQQTAADDATMGALGQPNLGATCGAKDIIPYCQQANYKDTSYCACQNSGVEWPECIFSSCQNNVSAYRTVQQQKHLSKASCPTQNVCQNIISIGGTNNVSSGYQNSNCGGTVNKIEAAVKNHPIIFIIVLVLILGLLSLVGSSDSDSADGEGALAASPDAALGLAN